MKKKRLKIFAASGLALFMGIGILCGVLVAPGNVKAISSAELEQQIQNEMQAKLLAGEDLGLAPETDPVFFTTDYGLEIKSHNITLPTLSPTKESGTSSIRSLSGYKYITAGGYNWVVIGTWNSSWTSGATVTEVPTRYESSAKLDSTAAGSAIYNEQVKEKDKIKINSVTLPEFTNAVVPSNGEIPWGCVLCLCEGNITTTTFHGSSNNYSGSNLQSYINGTVYPKVSSLPIVPRTLTTLYYSGTSTINNAYLFPLAARNNTESFYVGTYLNSNAKCDIDAEWWLRSGAPSYAVRGYYVTATGAVIDYPVSLSYGVRPAFVLQLYSA